MSTNPMRDVTIDDIIQYLNNTGIITSPRDFELAVDNNAFKYVGYHDHYHRYLVGFADEEDEENFYVSMVFVHLGANGLVCADFGGAPVFESHDLEQVLEYIEKRCN